MLCLVHGFSSVAYSQVKCSRLNEVEQHFSYWKDSLITRLARDASENVVRTCWTRDGRVIRT